MFLAHLARRLPLGICLGLTACLAACSLQMPSESDVFGSGGAKSAGPTASAASAGAPAEGLGGSSEFDPGAGLIAHFTFDEPDGRTAANAKDSSKNAKCVGTCTRPPGRLGLAFGIRNTVSPSDWIELPAGIFAGHSAITLSVWLRDLSTTRSEAPLFHFSSGAREAIYFTPDDRNFQASDGGAHLGGLHAGASFVQLWSGRPSLTDQAWHQVAVSWNSANIKLYIDGERVDSDQSPSVVPSELGTTSPNYLGRGPDDDNPALSAEIDDLRVYDRVLSAPQIALLYQLR